MKNIFYHLFWWIAGAKVEYLKNYPTEHEKYLHIGMTIFLTWLLATLGGIYAFSILFNNLSMAILAGVLWGLIIFNLDRYMMVTIKKHGNELRRFTFAEKMGNLLQEIIPTIPRIVIALILGIIITTPLEIYLFKDQINNNMKSAEQELLLKKTAEIRQNYVEKNRLIDETKSSLASDIERYTVESKESIKNLETRIRELETSIVAYVSKIKEAQEAYDDEILGKSGTGKGGTGPSSKRKKAVLDGLKLDQENKRVELETQKLKKSKLYSDLKTEMDSYQVKINELQKNRMHLYQQEREETDEYKKDIKLDNFMSQINILHETIQKDSTLYNIHIILMTLIMIFETSPILFKLLSARGAYEAHMEFLSTSAIIQSDMETKLVRAKFKREHFRKG
jgi:peptidoglycan hydrolase CwlO-like protein